MEEIKITRRMKWIIAKMKAGATLQESRNAFTETSTYWLEWEENNRFYTAEVKKQTLTKLAKAGLIKSIANEPVYRRGKFITSETVYGLKTVKVNEDDPLTFNEAGELVYSY